MISTVPASGELDNDMIIIYNDGIVKNTQKRTPASAEQPGETRMMI
jgi:hypothetical protein